MIATDDLLRIYLRGVLSASGARAVTLFVPPGKGGTTDPILIHEGEGPAVPELSSIDEAIALRKSAAPAPHGGDPSATRPILEVASSDPDGLLVGLVGLPDDLRPAQPTARRRRRDVEPPNPSGWTAEVWIGLLGIARDSDGVPESLRPLLQMAGVLASHVRDVSGILGDPLTGLPGRIEFESRLGRALSDAKNAEEPSMLLLINPDDFGTINETFGPERGDEVVRLVGRRLRERLRSTDMLARYGGAIFVALVEGVNEETGARVGQNILDALTETLSLDDSFKLTSSAGAVCVGPDNHPERPEDLIRRAEQALRVAKQAGGGCMRFWDPAHRSGGSGELDELSGVFTGNPSKDYRNMKLLSRTVTAIAGSMDFNELTSVVAARINSTLRADRVALIDWAEDGSLRVISAVDSSGSAPEALTSASLKDDPEFVAVLDEVRKEGRSVTSVADAGEHSRVVFGVPLVAGDACLGTLYVDGREGRIALDSSDVEFLQALGSQLALALDRARLSQVEMEWREAERQRLRAEIDELRQVFQKSELICESPQMTLLMATARRVAQTDATVLICGESGTGKERVSRTIHDLGPRRDKPLVVVDCASIPVTLIESELFGHERGAYTGAQDRKVGRLKEADRGTVILDEIGELPLEVQGKLLRFVQEKQLTPVGGNRVFEVDARVVAATNRNLEDEVREGRFREDLFHRLNVIRLDVPSLRSRPKDILSLTEFFLRQFSAQYQKGKPRRLSESAEARVLEYTWPGNVRELRNRIMQAVILSGTEQIGPEQLGLVEGATPNGKAVPVLETPEVSIGKSFDLPSSPPPPESVTTDDVWASLASALEAVVSVASEGKKADLPPLYRWLTEDLVTHASEAANQVLTRGADILGIPEATFRRKLQKAKAHREAGLAGRSELWSAVIPLLPGLVRSSHPVGEDLLRRARDILLAHVVRCVPNSRAKGAALMGVTDPTFRRWVKGLENVSADTEPSGTPTAVQPNG